MKTNWRKLKLNNTDNKCAMLIQLKEARWQKFYQVRVRNDFRAVIKVREFILAISYK